MALPTTNVLTVNSGTFTLRGNKDASISMEIKNNVASTETTSMNVLDIGDYEIELNIQEDAQEITELFYNVGEFKFSFDATLGNGSDFGEYLTNLSFPDLIRVEFTYDGDTELLICQASDFEYDRRERKYECTAFSPFKYNEQVSAFSMSGRIINSNYTGEGAVDIICFQDLCASYLDTFGTGNRVIFTVFDEDRTDVVGLAESSPSSPTTLSILAYVTDGVSLSSASELIGDQTDIPQGEFVIEDVGSATSDFDDFDQARGRVLETGIAENAIIGSFFDTAFYVRRDEDDATLNETVSASDLEEFGLEIITSPIRQINYSAGTIPNKVTEVSVIDARSPQIIRITVPDFGNTMEVYNSDVSSENVIETAYGGYNESSMGKNLGTNAIASYEDSFETKASIRYSGTILGIGNIKPYSTIEVDADASDLIQGSSVKIRPVSLTYNFKEDKVEFEGYKL